MPVIRDVPSRRRKRAPGLIDRIFHRGTRAPEPDRLDTAEPASFTALIDANTRTFWSRGADFPATLVEGRRSSQHPSVKRLAALVDAHERGHSSAAPGRPRANPAFTEALFVELMRAHQYQRAFAMLSGDCRRAWGSVDAFASAQGGGPMRRLRGVRVLEVRHLPEWTDVAHGRTYRDVAELDVEYTIGGDHATTKVPRVVHLVSDAGRWWSLCYPA